MLPDPAFYTQCLQNSHDELAEATATRTPPPKRRPRGRTAAKSGPNFTASAISHTVGG
jgi:hypothetical protein